MIFLFPMLHIVSTFAILILMLTLWLPVGIYNIWGRKATRLISSNYPVITPAALLLFVWGIAWFSSFQVWESGIQRIFATVVGSGESHLTEIEMGIFEASKYGYSAWEILFKRYGTELIYCVLTLISLPVLLRKLSSNSKLVKLLPLYGPSAAFVLAMVVFMGFNLPFAPFRIVYYALTVCTVFVGFVLYEILEGARNVDLKGNLAKVCLSIMIFLLVLLTVNGVFTRYYSRYILLSNNQVTSKELAGMDWFINSKDVNTASIYYLTDPFQYEHYFLTPEERQERWRLPSEKQYSEPPWHFNYDIQTRLGESYAEDSYLVLNAKGKSRFVDVFPEIAQFRFYPSDFDRLEDDPSLDNLYDNGGLDVWYVHPVLRLP
jgi:hypothetical protein